MVNYEKFNQSDKHSDEFIAKKSKFYHSPEWRRLRHVIIDRDLNECQFCGKYVSKGAHIDHIIELNEENFEDWNIRMNPENLQTLCKSCHDSKTRLGHQEKIRREIDYSKRNLLFED